MMTIFMSYAAITTAVITALTTPDLFDNNRSGVLIGAFAGSLIFMLSTTEFPLGKRILLTVVSFLSGTIAAPFSAEMISTITPNSIVVREPLGALMASAVAVRVIISISANSALFIGRFKRDNSTK